MNRYAIILAAGQGTRMKSKLYKVLHPVMGKAMVDHVLTQVEALEPKEIVTIVGCGAEKVKALLENRTQYALQEEQLGTGHAVLQAEPLLGNRAGTTLVVCGDTPLLTSETLNALFEEHEKRGAKATILTAHMDNPTGYGRIVRDAAGNVEKIVEHKDATAEELAITEINTGTYCFDNEWLFEMLHHVGNNNAQNEYYLPDVIGLLKERDEVVTAYQMQDAAESLGVNDRLALAEATRLMRHRINEHWMRQGVTMINPETTYIEPDVNIGADTVIEGEVYLKGQTTIGEDCFIGAHSEIIDSTIENDVQIRASRLEEATVRNHADVGPYARLRPKADIGEYVHIGDFVEVKNATLGAHTKAGHLAYIGDATLGENINVGCGAIFVNYDGQKKHHSTVGDNAFLGSNANIISPVEIGNNAFIAAGSTITDDIPEDAMGIARSRQTTKEGYAKRLAKKHNEQ